jgi:hypothetical protein
MGGYEFNPNNGEPEKGLSQLEDVKLNIQELVYEMEDCQINNQRMENTLSFDRNNNLVFKKYDNDEKIHIKLDSITQIDISFEDGVYCVCLLLSDEKSEIYFRGDFKDDAIMLKRLFLQLIKLAMNHKK